MSDRDSAEQFSVSSSTPNVSSSSPLEQPSAVAIAPSKFDVKTQDIAVSLEDLPPERRALAESLFTAVDDGNIEAVQKLIAQNAPLSVKNSYGETPLHWAVWGGRSEIINALLKEGALVNQSDKAGHTPLLTAAAASYRFTCSYYSVIRGFFSEDPVDESFDIGVALLKCGADFQETENWLLTESGEDNLSEEYAKQLAQALINLKLIYERYQAKFAAPILIKKVEDKQKANNILHETNESKEINMQAVEAVQLTTKVQTSDNTAAGSPKPEEKIQRSITKSTDLLLSEPRHKALTRALSIAMYKAHIATIETLSEAGKSLLTVMDKETAEIVKNLIDQGAPLNIKDGEGRTPVHLAAMCGLPNVMKALLATSKGQALVNQADPGYAPLHCADSVEIVKALLEKGASVNQANDKGEMPLVVTALKKSFHIGAVLLKYDANFEEAEGWLISKCGAKNASKEDARKYTRALTNLRLINKHFQASLTVPILRKIKASHGSNDDISAVSYLHVLEGALSSSPAISPTSSSENTPRESKESKQTKIQAAEVSQLTADIQQGDTAALRKVLATPVAQQSEPLQHYLQSQAIWTVLDSEAKPAHKSAQIALLAEAPNISLLVENEQRQLPLDVALQQLAKGRIDKAAVQKLQDATYEQRAAADEEILQAIEMYAQTVPTGILEEKASVRPGETKSTAGSEDGPITPQQLAAEVQKLSAADEALQQQFKTVSLPTLQSLAPSSSQPKQLSKQQRNLQKKLFQQMVHQLVSKKFIQSVGIGQGWVEAVSTKKATVAKAGVTFAVGTALNVAVPGVGGLIASGGKALAEKGYSERQKALSRKHTLGLISLKQLAMVTSYIEHYLLHRYQDFLLQRNLLLSKKAMEAFIHCLIERMCLYVEKIDKPEDIIPLLSDRLVNLSKRKKTSHAITPSVPFTDSAAAQVAENLVAGTSLLNLGLVDSLVDKVGSGTDALITCLTADGSEKELRVNDICHSPAVTLTAEAEKASLQVNTTPDDLEYEGRYAPGSQWAVDECGARCISREEADIENLSMITLWQDGLPISRAQSDIAKLQAKVQELEQQVAGEQAKRVVAETGAATEKARADAAERRANTEKTRADAAETRIGELEQQLDDAELSQRSLGEQLLAMGDMMEKMTVGKPASSAHHQSNGGPGMFAGNPSLGKPTKLPARTPPPVAGQPQSTLPFPSPGAIERVGL